MVDDDFAKRVASFLNLSPGFEGSVRVAYSSISESVPAIVALSFGKSDRFVADRTGLTCSHEVNADSH